MTVEERLERLERQNRRLKTGLASLLVVAVAAGLVGFAQPDSIPDVVEAKAFHVVGEDGTVLVKLQDSLGTGSGLFGTITTLNGEGKTLVVLRAAQGVGTVSTWNGEDQALVALGVAHGAGAVMTMNGEGQKLAQLGSTKDGAGAVVTYDPSGKRAAGMLTPR